MYIKVFRLRLNIQDIVGRTDHITVRYILKLKILGNFSQKAESIHTHVHYYILFIFTTHHYETLDSARDTDSERIGRHFDTFSETFCLCWRMKNEHYSNNYMLHDLLT